MWPFWYGPMESHIWQVLLYSAIWKNSQFYHENSQKLGEDISLSGKQLRYMYRQDSLMILWTAQF
jgi:hypothetical protein